MISFRLPLDDYEHFRRICYKRGVNNVSALVRLAVNQLVHNGLKTNGESDENSLEERVSQLEGYMDSLRSEIRRLRDGEAGILTANQ
jgi:hypothetical protein